MAATEVLLDHIPLTEAELASLLTLHSHYSKLEAQEPIESLLSLLSTDTSSSDAAQRQARLVSVEEAVPELARIFQHTVQTVFVIGVPGMDENPTIASQAKLLEAQASLLGRRGSRFLLRALFDACCCSDKDASSSTAPALTMMHLVQRLVLATVNLQPNKTSGDALVNGNKTTPVNAWVHSLAPAQSNVSWSAWLEWATFTAPEIHRVLSTIFHLVLLGPDFAFRPEPLQLPVVVLDQRDNNNNVIWKRSYDSMPASLAFMSLGGNWRRLYDSNEHGLSFFTFRQALLAYAGPTVILIQSVAGDTFGYYTASPWKATSKSQWYDNSNDNDNSGGDSFLFRLHPAWNVYARTGESQKYMQYLYTPAASYRQQKGTISGLAVGGVGMDSPRLHLNPTLEKCLAASVDTVFQSGPLLSSNDESFFDVDTLQVWAVNVTDQAYLTSLDSGQLHASVKEATRTQMACVAKAQFVNDFSSGAFINHLYDHRSETRGRHDFVAGEAEGQGYFVQDKQPSIRNLNTGNKK
jgi:hypothetical protein